MSSSEAESSGAPSKSVSGAVTNVLKLVAASAFLYSAVSTFQHASASEVPQEEAEMRRRLTSTVTVGDDIPSYLGPLMKDLKERKKLFEETPPEEVKYWFEYTGPLQVGRWNAHMVLVGRCRWNSRRLTRMLCIEILLSIFQVAHEGRLL